MQLASTLVDALFQLAVQFAHLLFGTLAGGDVADNGRAADHLPRRIGQNIACDIDDEVSAILAHPLGLVVADSAALRDGDEDVGRLTPRLALGRHQHVHALAENLVGRPAEDGLRALVPGLDAAAGIDAHDGVGRGGGDTGEVLFPLAHLLLDALLLAQVGGNPGKHPPGHERTDKAVDEKAGDEAKRRRERIYPVQRKKLVEDDKEEDEDGQTPPQALD